MDYWQQAWSVRIATITLIMKSHIRHATQVEMEAGGVWVGPFHAARATRSHAPARAAPVVPPYTALAGALYAMAITRHLDSISREDIHEN